MLTTRRLAAAPYAPCLPQPALPILPVYSVNLTAYLMPVSCLPRYQRVMFIPTVHSIRLLILRCLFFFSCVRLSVCLPVCHSPAHRGLPAFFIFFNLCLPAMISRPSRLLRSFSPRFILLLRLLYSFILHMPEACLFLSCLPFARLTPFARRYLSPACLLPDAAIIFFCLHLIRFFAPPVATLIYVAIFLFTFRYLLLLLPSR